MLNFYEKFGFVGSFYPFVFIVLLVPLPTSLISDSTSPSFLPLFCRLSSLRVWSLTGKFRIVWWFQKHLLHRRRSGNILSLQLWWSKVRILALSPTLTFSETSSLSVEWILPETPPSISFLLYITIITYYLCYLPIIYVCTIIPSYPFSFIHNNASTFYLIFLLIASSVFISILTSSSSNYLILYLFFFSSLCTRCYIEIYYLNLYFLSSSVLLTPVLFSHLSIHNLSLSFIYSHYSSHISHYLSSFKAW